MSQRTIMRWSSVLCLVLLASACGSATEETGDDDPVAAVAAATDPEAAGTDATGAEEDASGSSSDAPDDDAAPEGEPLVIGSTLSLTGFLAPTAAIHKVVGELYVERLNESGGLLGRPVEWIVLDDESASDKAAALYERLITSEGVDLVMGPYGTGATAAAMPVAQRHGFVFPHHTSSLTYAYDYDCQFPLWALGRTPNETTSNLVFDAAEQLPNPPQSVGFVTNQFPGSMFLAYGEPNTDQTGAVAVAEERGLEVVLDIQYPTNTSDWGPIAAQVREADPDLLYTSSLGADAANLLTALAQLGYTPDQMFSLWDAPGPLLALGDAAEGLLSVTLFEPDMPPNSDADSEEVVAAFAERAADENLGYPVLETQAAASWDAWEVLVQSVEGAGAIDHDAMCQYLLDNGAEGTFLGSIEFDPEQSNYYGDLEKIRQIQDGRWTVISPDPNAMADPVDMN